MRNRLLYSFLLTILTASALFAQGFEKTTAFRRIARLAGTADGGTLVLGSVPGTNGREQVAVARYAADGSLLWQVRKEWGTTDASAFAATPDGAGGWWVQGRPISFLGSEPLCNWHLNADGSEAAFFSGFGGFVRDAVLLGDTLWTAGNLSFGTGSIGRSPTLTSDPYVPYLLIGAYADVNYHTSYRTAANSAGDVLVGGGLATWKYSSLGGYYITGVSPYLMRFHPPSTAIFSKSYPFNAQVIRDFLVLPNDGIKCISQKTWNVGSLDSSSLFAVDSSLDLLWGKAYRNRRFEQLAETIDGSGTLVSGTLQRGSQQIAVLGKYNTAGDLLWEREFGPAGSTALTGDGTGNFWLATTFADGRPARLYKTDAQGWTRTNGVYGRLFQDNDQDCAYSPAVDGPLGGFGLALITGGDTLRTFSAADGTFALPANTGVQRFQVFPDNPNYVSCQPNVLNFTFPGGSYDTLALALGFRDTCPNLLVKPATDLACGPGSGRAAFRVSGGGGDYNFHWNTGSTDSLLTHLQAGVYWATISENGCETYDTLTVNFDYQLLNLHVNHVGSLSDDRLTATIATPDGQYFYSVGTVVYAASLDVDTVRGGGDIWLVKTDRLGNKIWAKTFGGTQSDQPEALSIGSDGSVLVTGNTQSKDGDFAGGDVEERAFLLRVSSAGQLIWAHKLDTFYTHRVAQTLVTAPNGDFVLGGYSWKVVNNFQVTQLWLARFDATGNAIWSKDYPGSSIYEVNLTVDAINGGYVGNCSIGDEGSHPPRLLKVDEAGTVVWKNSDERLLYGVTRQLSNGGFLIGGSLYENYHSRAQLVRTDPVGTVDTLVLFPTGNFIGDLIPDQTGSGNWFALTANGYPGNSAAPQIVSFNGQLQLTASTHIALDQKAELSFLYPLAPDTFFVAGVGVFAPNIYTDWLFARLRHVVRQDNLLSADTLVCPGSTIGFGLDALAGDYPQISWENPGTPVPGSITIGAQDTLLHILAQNAEGCNVVAERLVRTDKFRTEPETDGSTCTLQNGRIWLKAVDNLGPLRVDWADGNHDLARQNLAPGTYPVIISDSLCSQHFEPTVEAAGNPLFSGSTASHFYFHGFTNSFPAVQLTELSNGEFITWNAENYTARLPDWTLLAFPEPYFRIDRIIAVRDTTFLVVGTPYNTASSNILHFNRFGQLQGQYHLPWYRVADLMPLPNGEYVAVGDAANYVGGTIQDYQIVVARLNAQFQPVWLTTLPSLGRNEYARRMALLPDGRIVVAGNSRPTGASSSSDVKIATLDAAGILQGTRLVGGGQEEGLADLATAPDGSIIVAVQSASQDGDLTGLNNSTGVGLWLFQFDAGNQQIGWQRFSVDAQTVSHFPDGTMVYRTTPYIYSTPTPERLQAISPQGEERWSFRSADLTANSGIPFCSGSGDLYIPRIWYDNYMDGGSHCCPSADFHVFYDIYRNGETPQPFDLDPDTSLCIGDTITLSAAAAGTYVTWSPGLYDPELKVSRAGIYVAQAGSLCPLTDTIRVDYCLYPSLPDSLAGCAPLLVDGGMPGLAHQWTNGSTSEVLSLTESAWLGLTVTNLAGQTVHDSVFVKVYPISSYEIEQSGILCYGAKNGSLSVVPSGEGVPYSYLWSGDHTDSLLTDLSAGSYSLTVSDVFGCTFTQQFTLAQQPYWGVDAYASPNNDSTVYHAYASANGSVATPLTFHWSNGATSSSTQYPGGTLVVTITDATGCEKSDTLQLPFLVNVQNPLTGNELQVFPNPANEEFFVENIGEKPESVTLRDLAGRERALDVQTETGPDGKFRLRVSCQEWPSGMYLLDLRWGKAIATLRVVKMRP